MPPKRSDTTPGEKLLSLYTLLMLQGNRPLSIGDMATALECSKQTILRLINQMEASGYAKLEGPIIQGKEHLYRLATFSQHPIMDMGLQELAQLAQCRNILINILPQGVKSFLNAEKPNSGECGGVSSEGSIGLVYTKGHIDYAPYQAQYRLLLQAIRNHRVCHVGYQKSPSSPVRKFSFAPKRLILYRETIAFLGWEVTSEGEVAPKYDHSLFLYLQRIREVQVTQRESKNLPMPQAAQDGTLGAFGTQVGQEFRVKLLFTPATSSYVYDRQWSARQEMTILEDGSLLLDFDAQSKEELISWVLSFAFHVKVLEPQWLHDEIVNRLNKALARYQG